MGIMLMKMYRIKLPVLSSQIFIWKIWVIRVFSGVMQCELAFTEGVSSAVSMQKSAV